MKLISIKNYIFPFTFNKYSNVNSIYLGKKEYIRFKNSWNFEQFYQVREVNKKIIKSKQTNKL